jgi:hypothetical protein
MEIPMWFGMKSHPESPATWGARAILAGDQFDLVHDRQSVESRGPEHATALMGWLAGNLDRARKEFQRLAVDGIGSTQETYTLVSDWIGTIEANCGASHGYVYLRAYLRPEGYAAVAAGTLRKGLDESGDGPVWTCDSPPPPIGSTIIVTNASWASVDGRMRVDHYAVEHEHLFVVGTLLSPTKAAKAQNGSATWNVMGREWRPDLALVPFGTLEVMGQAEFENISQIEDRDARRAAMRAWVKGADERRSKANVVEVYMVLLTIRGALAIDRSYGVIGQITLDAANTLIAASKVTSRWADYYYSTQYPEWIGEGVWIAHPDLEE